MAITKKDFSNIQLVILTALAFALVFLGTRLLDGHIPNTWPDVFLIPTILLCGLVWFVVKALIYTREMHYLSHTLTLRSVGGLMGFSWFILVEVSVVIFLATIVYNGTCTPLSFWESHPLSCPFFIFLFPGEDFEASILLYVSLLWFIPAPMLMYLIGFFFDKYISRKVALRGVSQHTP